MCSRPVRKDLQNVCSQPFTLCLVSTALQAMEKTQGSKFIPASMPSGSILLEVCLQAAALVFLHGQGCLW